MSLVGRVDTPGKALGVRARDGFAFIADGKDVNLAMHLYVVDARNAASPVGLGTVGSDGWGVAHSIILKDNWAITGERTAKVHLYNISDPLHVTQAAVIDTNPGSAKGVATDGNTLFVADEWTGLVIFDITNPTRAVRLGTFTASSLFTEDVAAANGYAFLAAGNGGLHVIDAHNRSVPQRVAILGLPGTAWALSLSGNRLFVAAGGYVHVVDVSVPSSPKMLGSMAVQGSAAGITVVGSRAYVGAGTAGLLVLDVSDPAHMSLIGVYDTPDVATGVDIVGNLAYVADGDDGLIIVDVGDQPTATPTATATHTLTPTETATATLTFTATASATDTRTATPTPTMTRTATPTATASPTLTTTQTPTATASRAPTSTPRPGRLFLPIIGFVP
jgi:hypothetical protein